MGRRRMNKIIAVLTVLVFLVSNVNTVFAQSKEEKCDENCVSKVFAGEMTREELKYIGYGNVIRAVAAADDGDLTFGLYQLGLWKYNPAGTLNAVFGTNIPMEATSFVLQEDGSITATMLDAEDHLHVWNCYPNMPCTVIQE